VSVALALLSSLFWGTSDFLGGTLSKRLPVVAVYGGSQVFGAVVLSGVALASGAWRADLGYWPWAIVAAVCGDVGMLMFYRALALGPMGIVAPLVGLSVLIPIAWGLWRGEQPTGVQVVGTILAIGGIVLASGPELRHPNGIEPIVLSVLSVFAFGAVWIAIAEGSRIDAVMTATAMRLVTVVFLVLVVLVVRTTGGLRRRDLGVLAAIGITDGGANLAFGLAAAGGLLSVTSVLASLYPAVTAVFAALAHRERLQSV